MPTVQLEGVSLYYEEHGAAGAGGSPPLLLLHGLGSSSQDWELVTPKLAAQHRVILVDVRGHGRSDKPPGEYSVALFARDVAAFCDRLGLSGLHVIGLSMGGMIAFELVVRRPDLVRSLTIINSGPDMVPRTFQFRAVMATRLLMLRLLGPPALARMIARKLFPKPDQANLRQRTEQRLAQNDRDVYMRATRGLIGWTVLDHLQEIACPVLVLASEGDYTPVAVKQAYVARLRDARLEVVKDSGHAAPADQPDQVVDAILRFLGRTSTEGAAPPNA